MAWVDMARQSLRITDAQILNLHPGLRNPVRTFMGAGLNPAGPWWLADKTGATANALAARRRSLAIKVSAVEPARGDRSVREFSAPCPSSSESRGGRERSLWRTERAYGYQMDAIGPDPFWMSSGFQLVDTVGSHWRLADSDR